MSSVLITHIRSLVGVRDHYGAIRGTSLDDLTQIKDSYLLIEDGLISDYGPMSEAPLRANETLNANGGMVLPAWCDSHSHVVYHQSRDGEFVDRIRGLSYEEIAARGGGILNSARKLQECDESELFDESMLRIAEIRAQGTGAVEIKSGYGLTLESELKMLRVIRRIKEESDLSIKSTFLGAHAIPLEFQSDRKKYVDLICEQMIPQVADQGLADYCDVFCEKGYFSPEESRRILDCGLRYGLKPKIHANELYRSGGVQVAHQVNALSADHLECIGDEELNLFGGSQTSATLLPSTAFFLSLDYAPARSLIDHDAIVTLASDYNPGTTPSGKMCFVISLACIKMKMTPREAINAATVNGAYAMDLEDSHGSIRRGNVANLLLTKKIPSIAFIPYAFGSDHVRKVILQGKL